MYKPGRIDAIKNWFINIKTYDGKKKNSIYENGRLMTKEEALEIIRSTNGDWRNLMEKKGGNEDYLKKLEEKRIKFKY